MSDELLSYYNRELSHLYKLAAEFAAEHPKIAGRLRLQRDEVDDPHVERLLQGVAYLNARIRRKLDDDFPELSDALLGVLYPHYQRPIPSMTVVQFQLPPDATNSFLIRAESELETDPVQGQPCRFKTGYPVRLWPFGVATARMSGPSLLGRGAQGLSGARDSLHLELRCTTPGVGFAKMAPGSLRFFLSGRTEEVAPLYQLLVNHALRVTLAESLDAGEPKILSPDVLQPVGFDLEQGLLPYPPQAFPGYRLVTEYFAFPQKFLFFDLHGLDARSLGNIGNRLQVVIYFNQTHPELQHVVSAATFALGCTPVVNLYRQRAEPIQLTHARTEYRIVPDARRPEAHEIYSVDRVALSKDGGGELVYQPIYGIRHGRAGGKSRRFWYASRKTAGDTPRDAATEVFLSLIDLDFKPSAAGQEYVSIQTTCLNRDLPTRLPFGGGQPRFQLREGDTPLERINCLTAPTPTLRPPLGHGARWRLISHLLLNHLSITEIEEGTQALREILRLYDFQESDETQAQIEGIYRVRSRPVTGRAPTGGRAAFCRGTEVSIEFDAKRFPGGSAFLLASVLERFLALYCSINSFTRLDASIRDRGTLRKWPPRPGIVQLL